MEAIIIIALIVFLSRDGIISVFDTLTVSTSIRFPAQKFGLSKVEIVNLSRKDVLDFNAPLVRGFSRTSLGVPSVIYQNGGYTGRGNPSLSRRKYKGISEIDSKIVNIIENHAYSF